MFENGVGKLLAVFSAPGVVTEVLRGQGMPTPASFVYEEPFAAGVVPAEPHTVMEYDGDGTVNGRSLERATLWVGQQAESVRYWRFANTSHFGMLASKPALETLTSILAGL